jgi:ribonucleotide monophosphatase NagD (HAD superfamily)
MYRISLSFACSIRNDMRQTANKVLVVGSERFVEEVEDLTGKILKEGNRGRLVVWRKKLNLVHLDLTEFIEFVHSSIHLCWLTD